LTLDRREPRQERTRRYRGLIADASEEMADLLDRLSLVARTESGRYEPVIQTAASLALTRPAAEQVTADFVSQAYRSGPSVNEKVPSAPMATVSPTVTPSLATGPPGGS